MPDMFTMFAFSFCCVHFLILKLSLTSHVLVLKPVTSFSIKLTPTPDLYHQHEYTLAAKLCGHFVSHLFDCPDVPLPLHRLLQPPRVDHFIAYALHRTCLHPSVTFAAPSTTPTPRLDHFIAYTLHRTCLHPSVTFAPPYLLQHLKARFPAAKGSSHLFACPDVCPSSPCGAFYHSDP
jgi:hypothetical protein